MISFNSRIRCPKDTHRENLPGTSSRQALSLANPKTTSYKNGKMTEKGGNDMRDNFDVLKVDLINDVSGGGQPLSSINYCWVTANMLMLFSRFENKLKELRNPLWVRA